MHSRTIGLIEARPPTPIRAASRPLGGRWIDLLRDGNSGDYSQDWRAAGAFTLAAVRAGWTFAEYAAAMTDPDNGLARQYRKKDDGRRHSAASTMRRLSKLWEAERAYAAAHPQVLDRAEARQQLGLIRAAAEQAPWPGHSGPRNRVVFGVLNDAADAGDTLTPALSLRSICEQTSYRRAETIGHALDALADEGWITRDRSGRRPDDPTIYRLQVPTEGGQEAGHVSALSRGDRSCPQSCPPRAPLGRIHTDLAMAFGAHAAAVYATLDPDMPQRKPAVVRRSGISERTVDKWLRELARIGLARQAPQGWYQGLTDPTLVAAEHADLLGIRDARAARSDLNRRGFREHLKTRGIAPRFEVDATGHWSRDDDPDVPAPATAEVLAFPARHSTTATASTGREEAAAA